MVKKAVKKAGRRKKAAKKSVGKGPLDLKELRERLARLVVGKAEAMTSAAMEEAEKGHLMQLKYLFEMIGLYPAAAATEAELVDGNDLAEMLLNNLEFPHRLPEGEESGETAAAVAVVAAAGGGDSVE